MLKPLLARARDYHPEYRGGLCNHLPMVLIALDRMGASPARLQRYATTYLKNMEPAPTPGAGIDESDSLEWLGEADAYAVCLVFCLAAPFPPDALIDPGTRRRRRL